MGRWDAVERVWTFAWQMVVGWVISTVIGIIGLIWGILDVLWQLIAGGDGVGSSTHTVAQAFAGVVQWHAGQMIYAVTGGGDGGWRALPDVM